MHVQALLFLAMGIKGVFKIMSMTSSMVLINMAAPKGVPSPHCCKGTRSRSLIRSIQSDVI